MTQHRAEAAQRELRGDRHGQPRAASANQPAAATSACTTASSTAAGRSMRRRIASRRRSREEAADHREHLEQVVRRCASPAAGRPRARRGGRGRPRSAAGRAPRCGGRREASVRRAPARPAARASESSRSSRGLPLISSAVPVRAAASKMPRPVERQRVAAGSRCGPDGWAITSTCGFSMRREGPPRQLLRSTGCAPVWMLAMTTSKRASSSSG